MMSSLDRLARQYPKSPWRLRSLVSAANRYLLVNRPTITCRSIARRTRISRRPGRRSVPLEGDFPRLPARRCRCRRPAPRAPAHLSRPCHRRRRALFPGPARRTGKRFRRCPNCYQRFPRLSRTTTMPRWRARASALPRSPAPRPPRRPPVPGRVTFPQPKPVPAQTAAATTARIERSRLLRTAGLADLADSELRFGARTDGQPPCWRSRWPVPPPLPTRHAHHEVAGSGVSEPGPQSSAAPLLGTALSAPYRATWSVPQPKRISTPTCWPA